MSLAIKKAYLSFKPELDELARDANVAKDANKLRVQLMGIYDHVNMDVRLTTPPLALF